MNRIRINPKYIKEDRLSPKESLIKGVSFFMDLYCIKSLRGWPGFFQRFLKGKDGPLVTDEDSVYTMLYTTCGLPLRWCAHSAERYAIQLLRMVRRLRAKSPAQKTQSAARFRRYGMAWTPPTAPLSMSTPYVGGSA